MPKQRPDDLLAGAHDGVAAATHDLAKCDRHPDWLVREYKVYFNEAPHYLGVSFITALVP